jgi:hypothetical protein
LRADDIRSTEAIRHGAYVCLDVPATARGELATARVSELADRLGLHNEFEPGGDHPEQAIAFLRRVSATPAAIADDALLAAQAVVHVASPSAECVAEFCAGLAGLLGASIGTRVLRGVVRPMSYTGTEMYNFAYAHRVLQQPGSIMPNAFLVPMSNTAGWWSQGWMQRHTYFLPRFDDAGRMLNQGHALAAEAGIDCLMRRTYKHPSEPAPEGAYDFVTYFECADADVATFHEVCAALRDVNRNPEWAFVREGPTWQGRRVASWAELFD